MKTFYLTSKVRLLALVAIISLSILISIFGQLETTHAATCSFTQNEEKTAITERCDGGGNITLKQEGGGQKYSRSYNSIGTGTLVQCKEQITMTSNTQGVHKVFFGEVEQTGVSLKCGATSMGSVSVSSSGGSGTTALRSALNDIINKNCASQPNNSLRLECVSSWESVINQCVASEKNPKGGESYKTSLAKCIANKKSYSESEIKNALNNIDKDIENLDKIANCQKDGKDYNAEQDKCVEICEGSQVLDEDGKCVDGTTCAIDGIGWIICPAMNFMAGLNDRAYAFLSDYFLQIKPELLTDNATVSAWTSFRDIANVLFVIAFLAIIYSQITGAGVTNYGIKKMLPRIIIAAILVNISYFICQLAVDISNIVGSSIVAFFGDVPVAGGGDAPGVIGGGWEAAATATLAVAATVALVLLVILAPSVLLVLAMIVMILIARQAFVILLIVISPIAFVAYLLPNTEQWFKKWWKALSTLLLLFPIIGLVFGASSLASEILFKVAGEEKQMLAIVALGVQALPLFAVPLLLKGALSAAGSVGQRLSGYADKAQSRGTKDARDMLKRRGENVEARMAGSNNRFGRLAGGYRNRRAFGRKLMETDTARRQEEALSEHVIDNPRYDTRQQATAYQAVDKAWDDEVNAHQALYSSKSTDEQQLLSDMNNSGYTQQQRAAAAGMLMKGSRKAQNSAVRAAVTMAQSGEDVGGIQKQMAGDMGSRKPLGLGSGALAELKRGKLGVNPMPGEDKPPGTDSGYSFNEEIAKRAVAKVSAASIPDLDPDDLQEVLDAAKTGRIQGADLDKLHDSIKTATTDERINTRIDDSSRSYLDQINAITKKDAQDASAKTYGDNV